MSAQFGVEKSAFLPIPASSAFVVSEIGVKAASDGVLVLAFLTINETFACEAVGTLPHSVFPENLRVIFGIIISTSSRAFPVFILIFIIN